MTLSMLWACLLFLISPAEPLENLQQLVLCYKYWQSAHHLIRR